MSVKDIVKLGLYRSIKYAPLLEVSDANILDLSSLSAANTRDTDAISEMVQENIILFIVILLYHTAQGYQFDAIKNKTVLIEQTYAKERAYANE